MIVATRPSHFRSFRQLLSIIKPRQRGPLGVTLFVGTS